jgi:signal transduction histidine kinase
MSIKHLFILCAAFMALTVFFVDGRLVVRTLADYRAQTRAIDAVIDLEASLQVIDLLARERGPTLRLLTNSSTDRAPLIMARAATDAAVAGLRQHIQALLANSVDTPAGARLAELGTLLDHFEAGVAANRDLVDSGIRRPILQRDPGLTQAFANEDAALQQRFVPLLDGLQARVEATTASAASVMQVARGAADLREHAGLKATLISVAMADQRPFTPQEWQAAERTEGQITLLRSQIDAAIDYVGSPPTLVEAWKKAADGYFIHGQATIDRMLASGTLDGHYPVKMSDFLSVIAEEIPSLVALRDSAAAAAIADATAERAAAGRYVVFSLAILVAVVGLVIGLGTFITRRVVMPMLSLTGKIEQLAGGDRSVEIGFCDRKDELGGLARAMQVFKDALVEIEKLHGQLLQSQKMEAIGTIAGGVAHELDSLLQPTLLLCEKLADSLAPDDQLAREDLEVIVENARQARDIVRNIVMFARKTGADLTRLDVAREVRSAGAQIRRHLPAGITLESRIGKQPCPALVNRAELVQIVTNLVTNAAQAMASHGTVQLVVEPAVIGAGEAATLQILPGQYTALSVIDSGCGIDPALRDRIFEPFFTTKPAGAGTGLGLSVAFGIVRAWNGALKVDSTPGSGSRFSVLIPLVAA